MPDWKNISNWIAFRTDIVNWAKKWLALDGSLEWCLHGLEFVPIAIFCISVGSSKDSLFDDRITLVAGSLSQFFPESNVLKPKTRFARAVGFACYIVACRLLLFDFAFRDLGDGNQFAGISSLCS
ncbi:hypothetical protein NUW58_g9651 [Xylaria curta]|uniref:Uncharacterized protein n=1 Tax=Xylaria curta TaxID=42375 RepID=A0ACC1MUS2_9PEZI|nr:hypothetical protein NUW58_g9651 [Xylaria curta]